MEMQNTTNRPFSTYRFVKMFVNAKNDKKQAETIADIKNDIDTSHNNLATVIAHPVKQIIPTI